MPGLGRSPGERKGYPFPVFWSREFHGLYNPRGRKESDMTEQLSLSLKLRAPLVAQLVRNLPVMQETWVQSLSWEDPLRRAWQPTPVLLPGEIPMNRGAWRAAVHGVAKSGTRLSD